MLLKRFAEMVVLCAVLVLPVSSWAAHPLITDDAGTQGKGKFQLEVNGQYDRDKEPVAGVTVKSTGGEAGATLSYGIVGDVDLVLSLPYVWGAVEEDGVVVYDEKGVSDATVEAKWRFFEKDGLGFALKPGISFPTGDDEKGIGTGKTGYRLFLIGSKEVTRWAFHANLGYIRNENKAEEAVDLWHVSFATTYAIVNDLKLVANVGSEKNPDKAGDNDPAFLIAGVIYSVNENFDIDAGVKYGMNSSETDLSLMAGMAFRF